MFKDFEFTDCLTCGQYEMGCRLCQQTFTKSGPTFTNRLKLGQLSLCVIFKPQNGLKSVRAALVIAMELPMFY